VIEFMSEIGYAEKCGIVQRLVIVSMSDQHEHRIQVLTYA
jgi:hypothetical protein